MKEKFKKLLTGAFAVCLIALMFFPAQAQAAGKAEFSTTEEDIYVGKTCKIKLLNNTKKVKWSVTNSKIKITKKTNKYVTVKGIEAGTSYVKAKVGKKTCKCKITVMEKEAGWQYQKGSLLYNTYDTGKGVVCIAKNNGGSILSIEAKVVYYDENGEMLDTSSSWNYALEGKTQCALHFIGPLDGNYDYVEYSSYKLNINLEKASGIISKEKKIAVSSNMGADNVTAEVTNNSDKDLAYIHLSIVWYDAGENIIGYDERYAECENAGSTDYLTFDFPYDSNYDTVYPDSYKIYVDNAYTYTWMD